LFHHAKGSMRTIQECYRGRRPIGCQGLGNYHAKMLILIIYYLMKGFRVMFFQVEGKANGEGKFNNDIEGNRKSIFGVANKPSNRQKRLP